jgi:hypothetical protein
LVSHYNRITVSERGGSMDINLEDIFEIVEEPEHSKNVLLNFQEKYNIDSEELYLFYQQNGINYEELPVTEEDFKSWIHHFIIFKENGGDPWELKESDIWEENTNYQNKEENYSPCSFLFSGDIL